MIFNKGDKVVIPDKDSIRHISLLNNKTYTIHHDTEGGWVVLEEDINNIFYTDIFISIKEDRKRKINKLINKL